MIISTEADSPSYYDVLKATYDNATHRFTLQRINFVLAAVVSAGANTEPFDVAVTGNYAIRAHITGSTCYVERYTGEAASISSIANWAVSASAGVSVYATGATVRVFYASAGSIYYRESADTGASYGSAQLVGALVNVRGLAAVSTTELHVVTYDDDNSRLHVYEYDSGWARLDSNLYIPAEMSGFDAESTTNHVAIVYCTIGSVRYDSCRQGAWSLTWMNDRWSDPVELDVLDEYAEDIDEREEIKLSKIGGLLFASYVSMDAGFDYASFSRSADGQQWMHRQPMGAITDPGKLVEIGDYTYFFTSGYVYQSASTVMSGNSTVEYDITAPLNGYAGGRHQMFQSSIELNNADGTYDFLLETTNRWQVQQEFGYYDTEGVRMLQTV
ncbi:MAG: hypothetical protein KAJ19_25745, partial [Gammaproteobacteria bacterium]|nr:hypothetical protein [Gammaproteobacteria bacterium]